MISAFGVDHGEISKAFGQIAGKLERAAASGGPHAEYAAARLKAGQQGAKVAPRAQAAATKTGLRRVTAQARMNRGINTGQAAKAKAAGMIPTKPGATPAGMRGSVAERFPNKTKKPTSNWKKPAAIGGGVAVAGVGGYGLSQVNRG